MRFFPRFHFPFFRVQVFSRQDVNDTPLHYELARPFISHLTKTSIVSDLNPILRGNFTNSTDLAIMAPLMPEIANEILVSLLVNIGRLLTPIRHLKIYILSWVLAGLSRI